VWWLKLCVWMDWTVYFFGCIVVCVCVYVNVCGLLGKVSCVLFFPLGVQERACVCVSLCVYVLCVIFSLCADLFFQKRGVANLFFSFHGDYI